MTLLDSALAKGGPALACRITAGDGGVATIPDEPADASVAEL